MFLSKKFLNEAINTSGFPTAGDLPSAFFGKILLKNLGIL